MRAKAAKVAVFVAAALACGCVAVSSASALPPPTIEHQWVTGVSEHDATLNAKINPNGLLTVYKLQIDTTGNFRFDQLTSCVLNAPGAGCFQWLVDGDPLPQGLIEPPEGMLSPSDASQHVSVQLSSIGAVLQPGTTYHYRAIAANDPQVVEGPDLTFATPMEGEEPPPEEGEETGPEEEEPAPIGGGSPDPAGGAPGPPALPPVFPGAPPPNLPGPVSKSSPTKVGHCGPKPRLRRSHRVRRGKRAGLQEAPRRRDCASIRAARAAAR